MTGTKMTTLQAYAQHGSVSYGPITSDRLKQILLGAAPEPQERSRVRQALLEMPGSCAYDLAAELEVSYRSLNDRTITLTGQGLPA